VVSYRGYLAPNAMTGR